MTPTLCLVFLATLGVALSAVINPMPMTTQNQDMESTNTGDTRPNSADLFLIVDYIRPRVVEIVELSSDEASSEVSTTTEESSSESGESSTTTDHPVEKRNKHKIRYHIKNNYAQY